MSHESRVNAVAFSPDGRYLVTANRDGTTRVREMGSGREIARMIHGVVPEAVAFSPDGRYLATASKDHIAGVWEAVSGQQVARVTHENVVNTVIFSPDGRYLATASKDHTARVWLWRPDDLIAEACARLTRDLSREEWQQYLGEELYRKTCLLRQLL